MMETLSGKEVSSADASPEKKRVGYLRRNLGFFLKLLFVFFLFWFLWHSERIPSLDQIRGVSWIWVFGGLLCFLPSLIVVAWRYQFLLNGMGLPATFRQALSWSMIGAFFDAAMPSATGGDLVKSVYVVRAMGKGRRSLAVLSVLLDRLFGLALLFFLSILALPFVWRDIADGPRPINWLIWILPGIVLSWLALFVFLTSHKMRGSRRRRRLFAFLPGAPRWEKLYEGFVGLRKDKRRTLAAAAMCLFNHSSICAAVILFSYGMNKPLAVGPAFVLIPVGLFLNTFGVFGGLGAGQFAFDFLLPGFMLGGSKGDGTMLATLFHLTFFCAKLSGLPFYLRSRQTDGFHDTKAVAEASAATEDATEDRSEQGKSCSS